MTPRVRRPGVALLLMLVVLGFVGVVLGLSAVQLHANRRLLARREAELQAAWLARAGAAVAAAKLRADPKRYAGGPVELLPTGKVDVRVRREKDVYHVTSEARYPTDVDSPARHTIAVRYRRVGEGEKARLELAPE